MPIVCFVTAPISLTTPSPAASGGADVKSVDQPLTPEGGKGCRLPFALSAIRDSLTAKQFHTYCDSLTERFLDAAGLVTCVNCGERAEFTTAKEADILSTPAQRRIDPANPKSPPLSVDEYRHFVRAAWRVPSHVTIFVS